MAIVLLVVVAFAVIALIHLYLWKRLVRDATRPGRWRRVGAGAAVVLGLLVPATLFGTRTGLTVLAWPGYLWIALMFYLLVVLFLLEIPMLVARIAIRRGAARAITATTAANGATIASNSGAKHAATTNAATTPSPESPDAASASAAQRHETAARGSREPAATSQPQEPSHGAETERSSTETAQGSSQHHAEETGRPGTTTTETPTPAGKSEAQQRRDPIGPEPRGIERRLLLARGAAIFAGLTATGITAYGTRTALGAPRLERVEITLDKLPRAMDGFRITTVSDIHLGPLAGRAHTERVVAAINRTGADLVAVVGDLVDGSVRELGPAAAPLENIQSRQGVFFVTGNHEYYSGAEEWLAEVERLGMRTLRNERQLITGNGGAFDLAGVNDVAGEGTSTGGPDIPGALRDRDTGIPVVLLAHQPVQVHDAAANNVDLQLSGHTHGGQMVPFNLLVRLDQPIVRGYARFGPTQLYVTNGAGFWGPPVRVGAPPQVTLVELRSP